MTEYVYGVSIPYAQEHGVTWRDELKALLTSWRDPDVSLPSVPFIVSRPDTEHTEPCLWRTMPPDAWFEAQEHMAPDAVVPATACHPDDLRWLRALTGMTQEEFAAAMGSTQSQISRKEAGTGLINRKYWGRAQEASLKALTNGPGALLQARQDILRKALTTTQHEEWLA